MNTKHQELQDVMIKLYDSCKLSIRKQLEEIGYTDIKDMNNICLMRCFNILSKNIKKKKSMTTEEYDLVINAVKETTKTELRKRGEI